MKQFKVTSLSLLVLFTSFASTGCLGSFNLTKKVYNWNKSVGDKFVNELVFIAFLIVPVYSISLFIDGIILNSLEFWTGNNPVAMKAGESETKTIYADGKVYTVTAEPNKFLMSVATPDGKVIDSGAFTFSPEETAWYATLDGQTFKFADFSDDMTTVTVATPNGKSATFAVGERDADKIAGLFGISQSMQYAK